MSGRRGRSAAERLSSMTMANGDCLVFTGAFNGNGYGALNIGGRQVRAHRVAWEAARGPIPSGMHVLHACDNRRCVKVGHLFLGTHTENMADMARKRRARSVVRLSGRRLTLDEVQRIRERGARGESAVSIAADYPVQARQIRRVIRGERWPEHVMAILGRIA